MKFYAYTNKRIKEVDGKFYTYTFLGVVEADNEKKAMKRAYAKWPKSKFIDLKFAELVKDKFSGEMNSSKLPQYKPKKKKGKRK